MFFFPQSFHAPADSSFGPLFRLLEDYDKYLGEAQTQGAHEPDARGQKRPAQQLRSPLATFTPKFDVRETENAYELHGELPGLAREDVSIELTGPQTIVIQGRVERSYSSEPAAADNNNTSEPTAGEGQTSRRSSYHATVEDDPEEKRSPASTVAKPAGPQQAQPKTKYWLRERSVGEFSRAFTFPARVEYDDVTASLNNGVLTVTVPKAKKPVSRRIAIGY
ncbi:heat shock protein 30 [Trichocladium antarcticum]|uniref:Heat shock protein 30 n=1 Tax=Trichocladium antarcticum TaxID=1450529 RepID=A0AAN6UM81_9PEZI|nr:heat shock protein 30 [Trichocladium antarcticum]